MYVCVCIELNLLRIILSLIFKRLLFFNLYVRCDQSQLIDLTELMFLLT